MKPWLRSQTAEQFFELMHFDALEPSFEKRVIYQLAHIAQCVVNVAVEKNHRMALDKFVLKWGEDDTPKEPAWKAQQAANRAHLAASGEVSVVTADGTVGMDRGVDGPRRGLR